VQVVAIDGPVGSGKSTVAKAVADRLSLDHLETGAMYRAVAFAVLRRGVEPTADDPVLAEVAREVRMEVGERLLVDGVDVTEELRRPEVGRAVSVVAADPGVRAELVRRQREWVAERGGGVVDGRDIGSVVFPDATLRVYLTASEEERARRRGGDESAADVARRDRVDSSRAASPMVVPEGALVIDTTDRSVDDVVDDIVRRLG
jgi:CMP/dCMP kinase